MTTSAVRSSFADPSKLPISPWGRLSPKRSGVLPKPLSVPPRVAAVQVRERLLGPVLVDADDREKAEPGVCAGVAADPVGVYL